MLADIKLIVGALRIMRLLSSLRSFEISAVDRVPSGRSGDLLPPSPPAEKPLAKCAMPIARSAPAVASATEIARAKRSIFSSSHRDIVHSPAPGRHFSAARFDVMQFAYAADAAGKLFLQRRFGSLSNSRHGERPSASAAIASGDIVGKIATSPPGGPAERPLQTRAPLRAGLRIRD
jgi:hypothetical protein